MPRVLYATMWVGLTFLWDKLQEAIRNDDIEEIESLQAQIREMKQQESNNLLTMGALIALLLNEKGRAAFTVFRPVLLRLIMSFNQMTIAFTQARTKNPMLGISCKIAYTNICRKLGLIDGDTSQLISTLVLGVNTGLGVTAVLKDVGNIFAKFLPGFEAAAKIPTTVIFDIPDEPMPKEIPLGLAMKFAGMKARIPID